MKYKITLLFLLFSLLSSINVICKNNENNIQVLEPVDWEIMQCGKSKIGQKEKCTLFIINETDKPIQGYWLSNTNLLGKPKFAFIEANQSKKWDIKADEYWVFSDLAKNALGVYKTLPGQCKIIINDSNFANTRKLPTNIRDKTIPGTISGGTIIKEQTAYDVIQYDIKMEIFPDKKYIKATNTISAVVTDELYNFVFDLDTLLKVKNVFLEEDTTKVPLNAKFQKEKYWCKLPRHRNKGDTLKICVEYEGNPRSATHAPYQGGFSWHKTENCQHWIATSCQLDGADLWFPCKDYQWDEPDSVKLSFTVPIGLKAISNGVLKDTVNNNNLTTTYFWEVNNPINNYAIALNIAPYIHLTDNYLSLYGDTINISYWVLPENLSIAKQFYPNIKNYLDFIEATIGPYPFRKEKLGIVEVPYVGMEHQTIIAYGPNYTTKYQGYNSVLYHELCHEWFGNMITAHDWSDFWIQEGLTGYMEALYEEHLNGEQGYQKKMEIKKKNIKNKNPLVFDSIVNSRNGFDGDSYNKGIYLMHSLRYLIGKENIIKVLRIMAYPKKQIELKTNGGQCRFASTNDFFNIVEEVSNKNYDWFKMVYFKHAEVPALKISENKNGIMLKWLTKENLPFKMPLEIRTKDGIQKIDFVENMATIDIKRNELLEFDPNSWILFNIMK
ncbi:M1 family metallopeptidase [Desulfospira joergensenii]|uniref:M1 family metallopeptidase n=1 Tax=Desulfospira joergensenii TaxID=53329 RepID=UPI0003B428A0|nr:M1 family metallopeptidase [Desulfospira joergensenii]